MCDSKKFVAIATRTIRHCVVCLFLILLFSLQQEEYSFDSNY